MTWAFAVPAGNLGSTGGIGGLGVCSKGRRDAPVSWLDPKGECG